MLARKALAGTAAAPKEYVEDVFNTWLYTGTGSDVTITNNIDLSGKGGMVWVKTRSTIAGNAISDTVRGANKQIVTNSTDAESTQTEAIKSFSSTGFTVGNSGFTGINTRTYVGWTFRKAKKFFDIVTYTGNGTAGRTISHNLGSVPGCIIIKRTSDDSGWAVYHRSLNVANNESFQLNSSIASFTTEQYWNNTAPTSTEITLGTNATVNGNGSSYVAYVFAHDAGGFGDAGSDSIIKCSSFTCDGSGNATIDLGWEPQFVILKRKDATENWELYDNMRGLTVSSGERLRPSATDAEVNSGETQITNTGFKRVAVAANSTYIYIAIRRGPMKTPTTGTSVFDAEINSTSSPRTWTPGFPVDLSILAYRNTVAAVGLTGTRLTGNSQYLTTSSTAAEDNAGSTAYQFDSTTGNLTEAILSNAASKVNWMFRRAPGFFDVVTYTGTGSAGATTNHNLGVSPELIITKVRNFTGEDWIVHYRDGSTITAGYLNTTAAFAASGSAPSTDLNSFSSTSYTRNTGNRRVNSGSYNYVAYLFASCLGVSKIGAVTVASSAINVDCGFTSSARFVLLKRTSGASGWIVFDSARGIVAGDDPYLYLNSSAAENSDGASDIIDTYSSGFTLPAGGLSGITGEGTYLYLAIA